MPRGSSRSGYKSIAAERVERLFAFAEEVFGRNRGLADRYVQLAWRIKTRYNLKLPQHLKRKFCRKCRSFWKPGNTCQVRIHSGRLIITCLRCGHRVRLPYKPRREGE